MKWRFLVAWKTFYQDMCDFLCIMQRLFSTRFSLNWMDLSTRWGDDIYSIFCLTKKYIFYRNGNFYNRT